LDIENSGSKKFVKIKIIDSGIGIAPENLSKIFDRFRQIDTNDSNQAQGSGIGLALTKELVKMHNGHLKVRSKLGSGSRFSVYLPFDNHDIIPDDESTENVLESDLNKNDKYSGKKDRLMALVVDDNPDLREFIVAHFEPEYQVLEAKNGKEAWEISLDRIPDVIIADVMMPVMNGNELCKKLKRDERTSHIPVIMLSALSSSENQLQGIDAGADDYLTKPFDVGLLKAKVDNLLSIRKALRERYSKEMVLKPKDIILASPDEKFLKRLIALIEKNISKELLDVEFLSQNLDVSRTQLYRKIGALTDMTPKEFVKDIRLKRAAQLIVQNKLNISEVAYDVGFNDVSYFRKCFREKFGMSASDYKKSAKH
jgi:DNA-binding response OmpR family regulator